MSQVSIIVADRMIGVDGQFVSVDLDWSRFDGEPGTVLDDIAAVQFADGQGWVEYRTVITTHANRPNVRPPDRPIGQAEFDAEFAWVLPLYEARKVEVEAERAAAAERAKADAEAAAAARGQARRLAIARASVPQSVEGPVEDAATSASVEALKAELEAVRAQLLQTDTKLNDALVAAAKASEQQEGA